MKRVKKDNKEKRKNKEKKSIVKNPVEFMGSMTLEASLILSVVFITILFLIFSGFYMHNRAVLSFDAYILSLRGSSKKYMSNEEILGYVEEEARELYYDKYIAADVSYPEIKVGKGKVEISMKTDLSRWFPRVQITRSSQTISPVTVIRGIRMLESNFLDKDDSGNENKESNS